MVILTTQPCNSSMTFYNNVFASAYLLYQRYESGARFRAVTFVYLCILGALAVVLGLARRFFHVDFTSIRSWQGYQFIVIGCTLVILALLYMYYSISRTEKIIESFTQKELRVRRYWGIISISHFVLQWILFAVLIS